jgi:hypothetical protein
MKIRQTVVIKQAGKADIVVGSLTFNESDKAAPQRVTQAKLIAKNAIMAAQMMFPLPAQITVSVRSEGID